MTVTTYSVNRRAELTVSDEGPGIPQRVQSRIFERFYTADSAGGSGLGLAIARELAQRMDGRISITSSTALHRLHARPAPGRPPSADDPSSPSPTGAASVSAAARVALARRAAGPGAARRLRLERRRRLGGDRGATAAKATTAAGRRRDRRRRLRRRQGLPRRRRPAWSRSARSSTAGARRGLRLRPRRRTAEIVTNAHVVTDESSGERARRPKAVYVEFPDRNVVPAKIVGFDPFADVALLEVDPDGLDLHPLDARRRPRPRRRPAGGGDRQPVRRAAVALGRDRLGDRPLGPLADRIPDRGRDPDRRLDQPRQLGRAAARRQRPRDRDQPADRDQLRRQRRRRLRGPDLGGQALGRPARRRRQGRIRLHRRLDPGALPAARRTSSASTPTTAACSPKSSPAGPPTKAGLRGGDGKIRFQGLPTAPAAT